MNPRILARNALLLFVGAGLLFLAVMEIRGRGKTPDEPEPDGVIVYYLSQGKECATCDNIEQFTRETLEADFAEELDSGGILWRIADMDKPQHAHFVTDFDLYTKSVVLVERDNGVVVRFVNLTKVWDLVYDKSAFQDYIREELNVFLEAAA